MLENRNADKYTKAYEIVSKVLKGAQTFNNVLNGEANKATACKNQEKLLGTEIHSNKVFTKIKNEKSRKLNWNGLKWKFVTKYLYQTPSQCKWELFQIIPVIFFLLEKQQLYITICGNVFNSRHSGQILSTKVSFCLTTMKQPRLIQLFTLFYRMPNFSKLYKCKINKITHTVFLERNKTGLLRIRLLNMFIAWKWHTTNFAESGYCTEPLLKKH